ncbi:hypothetical protein HTZ97_16365 [Desulfuromonas acetoxidans]|uniref:Uncharacterized protein n=1 Tax=Desulfuromonas acetoxidans (strain DSM 684 / 11070) TaxID=281689 RepID=Q1K075_DESA6|nr:hypothetical protein [Desulfuromonas acetoxidans]EAT16066.1 hypothetical protein Dace_2367 [Desulfuromonas acetoxidans DSM 684]MBF0646880.1 hypothetical protein [Desulfuromonas acetoxidans]NVD26157.1 hypothetical protein [Desulfuromonas acetoxidans]NVE18031.1 hypothetical protein [Desulfuromonas acetoxidans]
MQTKRRIIAAAIEAIEGTAETLTAANTGIIVRNPAYTPDISMLTRDVLLATFSKLPDLTGAQMAKIDFEAEIMGRGVAYAAATLPRLDPYFKACGLAATVDETADAETVTYVRASSDIPSLTIAFLDDDGAGGAVLKQLTGARGTVAINGNVGGPLYAKFSFTGAYNDVADTAQLVASYDDIVPPQLLGTAFDVGGFTPTLPSFSLDLQNKLAGRQDMTKASGYASFEITDGDTRGSFDPEMVGVSIYDHYGKWKSGDMAAMAIGPIGADQYNQIALSVPRLRATNVQETDRDGQQALNVSWQAAMTSGDDEFSLVFS